MMIITKRNKGFSLIEVMIALLVLALGILGVSKLQGTLIKSGSDANRRTVAIELAQKKIDDLKSFMHLNADIDNDGTDDTWSATAALNQQSYAFITGLNKGQGGTICPAGTTAPNCPTQNNANNLKQIGNYEYSLEWTVTPYYYNATLSNPASTAGATVLSEFKNVVVNVAWQDEAGVTQTVSLETVIDAYAPQLTALSDNSTGGSTLPQAKYTPELAPDVIDITVDAGDGIQRQTSKPLPDAVKTGADANTLVTFEVMSYHVNPDDSSEFLADRQEEFMTLDCTCSLSATNGIAYPPGHVVWDETDNNRYDSVGSAISKATATQTGNANAVDEFCTICCRDHHDVTSTALTPAVRYDRQAVATGDHAHYKADGTVAGVGNEYIESCRFKRIDGIMRVFQDWNLLNLTVMNRANLTTGDPVQTQYTSYVDQLLKDQVEATSVASKPPLRTPIITTLGVQQQLESRGVYIDQVYDINDNVSSAYASYVGDSANIDRLERIPFAEVNLTLLSSPWISSSTANVTVTDEAVATIVDPAINYYGSYSRGWINALAEASPASDITTTMRDDNDGLTQITSTPSPTYVTDTVTINVEASAGAIAISGSYGITFPLGNTNTPTIAITGGGSCTLLGSPGNTYSCSVSAPWSGTIQISVAVTTGAPPKRCTGSSILYSGSGLSTDQIHNFVSFACN